MLLKILAWLLILSGIVFSFQPVWLRFLFRWRSYQEIKRILFGVALILGFLLVKATWGASGIFPKIIMILGLLAIIRVWFFLQAKAAKVLIEWFASRPIQFFRYWAIGQSILGMVLLLLW